uniref:Uncharacterized protein n=1 Tax=Stegastes partitus TaxID=144197 RepID=A0A3B5ABM1_9TELE
MVLCVDCNPTLTQLKADVSRLQDALKERDKLILELSSVAAAQSNHLSLLSPVPQTQRQQPRTTTPLSRSPQPVRKVHHRRSSTGPAPQLPSVLIVGDPIIRDVRSSKAVTHCFPGAKVNDILTELPSLMAQFPSRGFLFLFFFISGPLPTVGHGCGRLSRLLQIHVWLQSQCCSFGLGFIDNFNLFWELSSFFFFKLHPNRAGSRMLAANLFYSISSCSPGLVRDNPLVPTGPPLIDA